MKIYLITDSVEEAMVFIEERAVKKFSLKRKKDIKPVSWLGESN